MRARVKTHLTLKAQSDLLRQWVYLDGLTGVHNRRHFDERLASEWARALRNGTDLSVLLLDVDLFKRYNDHYGHQAGDDCLRQVAPRCGVRRPGDLLARYGGEEFGVLLPVTPLDDALALAGEMQQAVAALGLPHALSTVADAVTVSLGVCSRPAGCGQCRGAAARGRRAALPGQDRRSQPGLRRGAAGLTTPTRSSADGGNRMPSAAPAHGRGDGSRQGLGITRQRPCRRGHRPHRPPAAPAAPAR